MRNTPHASWGWVACSSGFGEHGLNKRNCHIWQHSLRENLKRLRGVDPYPVQDHARQTGQACHPAKAEWEYCCRAGTTTKYSFGDEAQKPGDVTPKATLLGEYGWHTGNAAGNDPPVGALKPNPWGLYDMHGYLWEFTADGWNPDYKQAPQDGSAAKGSDEGGAGVVLRSGSWKDPYDKLTSSSRRRLSINAADDAVGFRCVMATAK